MRGQFRTKFTCPACKQDIYSRVKDTEPCYNGYKRYRICEKCDSVFVTMEKTCYALKGGRRVK